jgi:hypothetical protein
MSETQDSSASSNASGRANAECFCGDVRRAFEEFTNAFTPPENVQKHFREARVQVLMGIREMITNQIDHLNRPASKGTRVVVE